MSNQIEKYIKKLERLKEYMAIVIDEKMVVWYDMDLYFKTGVIPFRRTIYKFNSFDDYVNQVPTTK